MTKYVPYIGKNEINRNCHSGRPDVALTKNIK